MAHPTGVGRAIVLTGRNADVDTGTEEIAAVVRGTLPANEYVASTASTDNTNDKAAGTGALTLLIRGIEKTTYREVEETIVMNGTSAVTTTQKFIRLNEAVVISCGTNGSNTGTITVSLNSQAQLTIPIGHSRSNGLFFAVPADAHLDIDRVLVTPGEVATTQILRYQVFIRDYSVLDGSKPWMLMAEGDLFWAPIAPEFNHELVVPAKHEIKVVAITSADNKVVGGVLVATLNYGSISHLNMIR